MPTLDARPDGRPDLLREEPTPDRFVQALARGLRVLAAFSAESPAMTLSEVARRVGTSRASARRFLLTLRRLGYARLDDGAYSLTPRVLELGESFLSTLPVVEAARGHLELLSAALGEPAYASVLDGGDIVYVVRAHDRRSVKVGVGVGTRVPACAASMGRVILAALPDSEADARGGRACDGCRLPRTAACAGFWSELPAIRSRGWCVVDGEPPHDGRSVAMALDGAPGAAIGVATHASPDEIRRSVIPRLRAAARSIRARLRSAAAGSA